MIVYTVEVSGLEDLSGTSSWNIWSLKQKS
jgi:hypothetical protein